VRPDSIEIGGRGVTELVVEVGRARVEQQQRGSSAAQGGIAAPPSVEVLRGIWADAAKAPAVEPDLVESLGGPEDGHDVRLTRPFGEPDSTCELGPQVGPLGVVAAERILDVRESCAVLDVDEGRSLDRPSDHVCPARELEVLERLIEANLKAEPSELSRLDLAHGSVDGVLADGRPCASPARIAEADLEPEAKRLGQPKVGLEARHAARLDRVHGRESDAGEGGQSPDGHSAPFSLGAERDSDASREAPQVVFTVPVPRPSRGREQICLPPPGQRSTRQSTRPFVPTQPLTGGSTCS
jgi:hypothetical protein